MGACFDNDVTTLAVPRMVSGVLEMTQQIWDQGLLAWGEIPLTSGSAVDNFTPQSVRGGSDDRCGVVFARGTYTDDATFDTELWGARTLFT